MKARCRHAKLLIVDEFLKCDKCGKIWEANFKEEFYYSGMRCGVFVQDE